MVPYFRSTTSLTRPDPSTPVSGTTVLFDAAAKLTTPWGSSLPRIVNADADAASISAWPVRVTPEVETRVKRMTYSSLTSGMSSGKTERRSVWEETPCRRRKRRRGRRKRRFEKTRDAMTD